MSLLRVGLFVLVGVEHTFLEEQLPRQMVIFGGEAAVEKEGY